MTVRLRDPNLSKDQTHSVGQTPIDKRLEFKDAELKIAPAPPSEKAD